MQMFPNLAERETCVAETNFAARKQKMFLSGVKNIFASRTQILHPKHMFPSLGTPGNITRSIISATMIPSLARPLHFRDPRADFLVAGIIVVSVGGGKAVEWR